MKLNLGRTLKEGYGLVRKRKEAIWISLIIIISAIPMNFLRIFGGSNLWILIATTVSIITGTYLYGSMIRMYQKRRRRKNILTRSIVDMKDFFPIFLATTLIVGLATFGGMRLLIIPGLIILTKFLFAPITVVSEELGIVESLKRSWNLTKGHEIRIFTTVLALFAIWWAINLAKFLPLLTGFSFSTSILASIMAYKVGLLFFLPFSVAVTYKLYEETKSSN